jgi:hypothetical protein
MACELTINRMKKEEAIRKILGSHRSVYSPSERSIYDLIETTLETVAKRGVESLEFERKSAEKAWKLLETETEKKRQNFHLLNEATGLSEKILKDSDPAELAMVAAFQFTKEPPEDMWSDCWPIPGTGPSFSVVPLSREKMTLVDACFDLGKSRSVAFSEMLKSEKDLERMRTKVATVQFVMRMHHLNEVFEERDVLKKKVTVSWSKRHQQNEKWVIEQNQRLIDENTFSSANARYEAIMDLYKETFQDEFEKDYPEKDRMTVSEISDGTIRKYLGDL